MFYTYARHYGNKILYRGISANGKRQTSRNDFQPTLFVKSDKPSEYKSMFGESVSPVKFPTNKEASAFIDNYSEVSNFPIYGQSDWGYQYITAKFPEEVKWDQSLIKIISIDIETTVNNGFPDVFNPLESVTLITIQDASTKRIITWGCGEYTPTEHTEHLNVDYNNVLQAFLLEDVKSDAYLKYTSEFKGFGGSCLPKDVSALNHYCAKEKLDLDVFDFTLKQNDKF